MTDDTTTQTAAPAGSWKTTFLRWTIRAIGAVMAVVVVLVVVGTIMQLRELPECDSKTARNTLSDVFKAHKVSASKYDYIKTLAKGEDVTCTASVSLWAGGHVEVDYRFFWDNKSKNYKVTRLEPKP